MPIWAIVVVSVCSTIPIDFVTKVLLLTSGSNEYRLFECEVKKIC